MTQEPEVAPLERSTAVEAVGPPCPTGATVAEALHWGVRLLAASGGESPRLDAEVLLAHVLGGSRSQLHARWSECPDQESAQRYTALVRRRARHEPVAYLVGQRAFYDVDLIVSPAVLIPRPETEHLVEEALRWVAAHPEITQVADVGTGSGALAVVLAGRLPRAQIWAVDVSPEALRVAAENVRRYGLSQRVTLVWGDLLSQLKGPFDLIMANLPYVRHEEIAILMPDVAQFEPHLALDGGADGLDLIRRLAAQLPTRLAQPGLALFEIDPRQAEAVQSLLQMQLPDATCQVLADYAGLARLVRVERGG
jgi:release factor glutamine methyltransferase